VHALDVFTKQAVGGERNAQTSTPLHDYNLILSEHHSSLRLLLTIDPPHLDTADTANITR